MKSASFRVGNIVSVCYGNFKPDTVIILEPGLVQLAGRPHPDDERDIIGVFLTLKKLAEINFVEKNRGLHFSIHTTDKDKIELSLSIGKHIVRCKYWHELQNLYFSITGEEIFPFSIPISKNHFHLK
jgi:hypothetical protein